MKIGFISFSIRREREKERERGELGHSTLNYEICIHRQTNACHRLQLFTRLTFSLSLSYHSFLSILDECIELFYSKAILAANIAGVYFVAVDFSY